MDVKPLQNKKQLFPKLVTDSGIWLFLQPAIIIFLEDLMIALQLSLESYTGLSASTTILSRPSHPAKQASPKLVTELGMVMEVKPLHNLKQPFPKLVTEFGMVMEVKPLQPSKQLSPKLVTELGMVMEVKPLHNLKQPFPKLVMVSGMVMDVKSLHQEKQSSPKLVTV